MAGGNLYTEEDMKLIMDPNLMAKDVAKKLNRTVGAINAKRHNMGYKSAQRPRYTNGPKIFLGGIKSADPVPSWPYNMLIKAYIIDGTEPLSDVQFAGLEKAMECFTTREREAIKLYFEEEMTLDECGKELHITRERVRQVIAKALRKLRHSTRANLIVYGENIREHNRYLEHLREVKDEIAELEAYIKEHKETYSQLVKDGDLSHMNDISLMDMDLSIRSYNALKRKDIKWASEVVKLVNSGEIIKVRNLGRKSYLEIINKLKELGYNVEVTA